MTILAVAALLVGSQTQPEPLLWMRPTGEITIAGAPAQYETSPGTTKVRAPGGIAFDFDGRRSGLLLGDPPQLKLTGSMTVSAWLYLRSYINDGPGAQVLFRGDDRNGLDPYSLAIIGGEAIQFGVCNDRGLGMAVASEAPLFKWFQVVGTFDDTSGQLALYLDGRLMATALTTRRPFAELDPAWAPGMGIGNVQNSRGPHNQPLNGMIMDLRVYDQVVDPAGLTAGRPFYDRP